LSLPPIRPERLREVFWDLVGIYSPSGKEQEILGYVEEVCARYGCPYGVQPVDEDRYNLILGRSDAALVFVGHLDTVSSWDAESTGPVEMSGGWVRGLGTADMKGGCAALLEAYLILRDAGLGRQVGLALLVGEEEDGDGARAFLGEASPGRAIVAEPTGLRLCTAHYGYVEAILSAKGRRAHASLPERGQNAAQAVLAALHALLQDPYLREEGGPVQSIRHLETSNPGFAVPERASAWVDLHVPPDREVDAVVAAVDRIARQAGPARVTAEYPFRQAGFSLPETDPLVAAYRAVGGRDFDVFRSHSDANLFHCAGIPTAVLGPGNLEYAHSEDEGVDFGEVVAAAHLFVGLARAFLAS